MWYMPRTIEFDALEASAVEDVARGFFAHQQRG
jgi:hypothetical protein